MPILNPMISRRALLRLRSLLLLALALGAFGLGVARGQTPSREYQLKAVFLYNFVQFTQWPEDAFTETNSPIVIGVLGNDPFGRVLDETVRGEKVNGRSLVVQRYDRVEDVQKCHLLFISPSEANRSGEIFERLKGRSILTVGETDGFSQSGGMIRFYTEKNKIQLRINVVATKGGRLTISSKLLRLAEIVTDGKD